MRRRVLFGSIALALLILSGCGLLKRTKSRFFTIDPVPSSVRASVAPGMLIGVEAFELPPGMDRREIVVTKAAGELEIRERDQWSAPLESLLLHAFAHNLAGRLPEGTLVLPGQPKPVAPMRAIDVVIERLDAGPLNTITIDARWTLRARGNEELTRRETIVINVTSLESGEIAGGIEQGIATLADRVVAQLASGAVE